MFEAFSHAYLETLTCHRVAETKTVKYERWQQHLEHALNAAVEGSVIVSMVPEMNGVSLATGRHTV